MVLKKDFHPFVVGGSGQQGHPLRRKCGAPRGTRGDLVGWVLGEAKKDVNRNVPRHVLKKVHSSYQYTVDCYMIRLYMKIPLDQPGFIWSKQFGVELRECMHWWYRWNHSSFCVVLLHVVGLKLCSCWWTCLFCCRLSWSMSFPSIAGNSYVETVLEATHLLRTYLVVRSTWVLTNRQAIKL